MNAPKKYHKYSRWEHGEAHPIQISPSDLDILHKVFVHGPLSSDIIHSLIAPRIRRNGFVDRLTLMDRTPNVLLDRPAQQRGVYNANYPPITYAITKKGIQALKDFGRITEQEYGWYCAHPFKHYQHDTMAAYITASIELGCQKNGLRFIPWMEILGHPKCPETTKASANPLELAVGDGSIISDALFGIERNGAYTFFALEAVRHTEPIETHELKRSSYRGKLNHYRRVFKENLYQKQFGVPNMIVLTVTVSDLRMKDIMAHLKRLSTTGNKLSGTRPFRFESVPTLNAYVNKPPATAHMLTSPWARVGFEDFYIGKE